MEILIFKQLTEQDIRQAVRNELEAFFADRQPEIVEDEIGGIDLAVKITGKAKPTIYNYCSSGLIPHSKRGKRLYFSSSDLLRWIRDGKCKTHSELALDAENFSSNNSKQINKTVTPR